MFNYTDAYLTYISELEIPQIKNYRVDQVSIFKYFQVNKHQYLMQKL